MVLIAGIGRWVYQQSDLREGDPMRHAFTALMLASLFLSGCADSSGGGSSTINQRVVVYGIGKDGVAFVIFTDIPALHAEIRSGGKSDVIASQQAGSIVPASGPRVDYAGDSALLTLGGQEYTFAKGRLFLVATRDGNLNIQQLSTPIHPTDRSSEALQAEIRRLAEDTKVSAFMAGHGQGDR
jgi:hypothetical protein